MQWSIERKISSGFAIALLILSLVGGLGYWSTMQLIAATRWVDHTHIVIENIESLLGHLASAEAGQRGYIITGNEQYLQPYYLATAAINDTANHIQKLTVDNSSQQQRLQVLQPALKQRVELLEAALEARRLGGLAAAQALIEQDVGRKLTSDIRQIVDSMLSEERRLLELRFQQSRHTARNTTVVVGLGGLLTFGLVPLASLKINRNVTRRRQVEAKLQESQQQLKQWVGELEERSSEMTQLGELSDVLQVCFTLEEAYTVLAELVHRLFPQTVGGVFIINDSKTLVEAVATWGEHPARSDLFAPTDCWALRRGRSYFLPNAKSRLHCQHFHSPLPNQTLCVPMMAQGEAIGTLQVMATAPEQLSAAKQQLATTVAEHVAIALANLKLRETLKNQSIRDPLTGLFNRRYMEESLEREMRRAERNQQSLSIIMLDVDHFKRFNDTFGHEAGDMVLRELGQFLQGMIRASDTACRYGGEEFMLLLPEASIEIAGQRAEQLRLGAKHLNLEHRREPLGVVTLSLGIACFPQHGNTADAVIRAADAALYRAKAGGRDLVVIAE
ncbi:diguanylate cyclase [Cyanobacteria bacterium FACHB-472]|nr:diguanylate cyclase [Cyanobacteria bacterium FACHB-472]